MLKRITLVGLLVVALVGLWVLLKPHSSSAPTTQNNTQQPTTKEFTMTIKEHSLTSGSSSLTVKQGDKVIIHITSDEPEELHLHGYDMSVELEKDKPGELSFTANVSGSFPFELEHSSTELGTLQVQP